MNFLHKVALVAAAVTLVLSGMALIQGELGEAALGVFVAVCAFLTSGVWPTKPLWGGRRD